MARILVTQQLVEGGLELLESSDHQLELVASTTPMAHAELVERARGSNGIICLLSDVIDDEVLSTPGLEVVGNVAVGVDNIDLEAARRHSVTVVNTPGVLDDATAEITVLLMLATRRRASDAEADLRTGRWAGWGLGDHLGLDLSGARLGLVGYGRIASAVARRAVGFDMEVLHHTRSDTGQPGWISSLTELAAAVDVLSIHVPLTDATTHLIDASVLSVMAPTAVLINTSRGAVVDERALADALDAGRLWGAGLDVYEGEPVVDPRLLAAPHTVLLPHIGSATIGTRQKMCRLATAGVLSVLAGQQPTNTVTIP